MLRLAQRSFASTNVPHIARTNAVTRLMSTEKAVIDIKMPQYKTNALLENFGITGSKLLLRHAYQEKQRDKLFESRLS